MYPVKLKKKKKKTNNTTRGNSLAVQTLGIYTVPAEGVTSIPGQGTAIPQTQAPATIPHKKTPLELISLFFFLI